MDKYTNKYNLSEDIYKEYYNYESINEIAINSVFGKLPEPKKESNKDSKKEKDKQKIVYCNSE